VKFEPVQDAVPSSGGRYLCTWRVSEVSKDVWRWEVRGIKWGRAGLEPTKSRAATIADKVYWSCSGMPGFSDRL